MEYFTKLFPTDNYQVIDIEEDSLSDAQIVPIRTQEVLHLLRNRTPSEDRTYAYNELLIYGGVGLSEKLLHS